MAVPAAGPGLRGDLHRRDPGEDPRGPGREPARLPGAGGDRRRRADILGLWAGEHGDGEGAKFWLRVLTEIKNRGTRDVLMVVCDGLKGLPDSVNSVWEKTIVQTCI